MSSLNSRALADIAQLRLSDVQLWLAIAEDQLRKTIPENSRVFSRFLKLKENAEKALQGPANNTVNPILDDIRNLMVVTRGRLEAEPPPLDSLKEEVERIIQVGYFKSPYFRFIVGALIVAMGLVTGVYGFKAHEQVQAMERMLDEAHKQVAEGTAELAKARSESNNRQADLALLIVQGNADLAKQRLAALNEMQQATDLFKTEFNDKVKRWDTEIESAGTRGKQSVTKASTEGEAQVRDVTQKTLTDHQKQLAEVLVSKINALEATQHPWVPRVIWSMAKEWLFIPLALFLSFSAWLVATSEHLQIRGGIIKTIICMSGAALAVVLLYVKW